jgi:predicted nucleic acid-binding protein
MNFLLDTTAFSDLMREHPGLDARLAALDAADRVFVCSITRGEVAYGIGRLPDGKRRQALEAKAQKLFAVFPCEPVPDSSGEHYARAKLARQRSGLPLDENDLWIAATALALGATLVTRDNDFRHIDGLTVDNWTA